MCFSRPQRQAAPATPPAPPTPVVTASKAATPPPGGEEAEARRRRAQGRAGTIVTGPRGLLEEAGVSRRTLLG